jgi:exonuclease III
MDMRFGTWNVRSMYRAGLLRAVAEEISKYELELVGIQEVRWGRGGTESADEYACFYGQGNENHELRTDYFVYKRIISAVKRVGFIRDEMSYIILGRHWGDIIVLNVHAPTEDKIDDVKDRFYKVIEHVFDKYPKYNTEIMLGDFSAKVGKEDILKPTVGNERLHKTSNDNGVRVVNFATSKNLSEVQCSHIVTFINLIGHFLMGRRTIKLIIF